jgi:hypothetical protein
MDWDTMSPDEREALCGVPYPKVTVCRRPHYIIQFEQVDRHTFVHVQVARWTPTIRDDFTRDCDALQDLLDGPVLVLCTNRDNKLRKFCAMFGFEHALDAVTAEGEPASILVRNKKKHGCQPLRRRNVEN